MSEIPEDLVIQTRQEMSVMSPQKARLEIGKIGRAQPNLLAFVLGSINGCGRDAQELGIYLYFVIHHMFRRAAGHKLGPISNQRIEARLTDNEKRFEALVAAHPRFSDRAAKLELSPQPQVVKYLIDAIMEAPEGAEPVQLTDEEIARLYLVLKTAIDLLHEELKKDPPQPKN